MSKVLTTNYSGISPVMQWPTADSDQFAREDVANTAQGAVEQHDHTTGKGLGVGRVQVSNTPVNAGEVQITSTDFKYADNQGSPAVHTVLTLDIGKTLTGNNIFNGTSTFGGAVSFTSTVSFTNAPSFSGLEITAKDFAPSGLTGATSASRYVGGTTTGAPVSGTFAAGDFVIAEDGNIFVCSAGGTPGTWSRIGNPMTTQGDIIVGGASGALGRQGIGTARQYLRANSGATGLEYAGGVGGALSFQNAADLDKKMQRVSGSVTTNSSGGGGTGNTTLSWPSTFGSTPVGMVTVTNAPNSSAAPSPGYSSISTTTIVVVVSSAVTASATYNVEAWGIG